MREITSKLIDWLSSEISAITTQRHVQSQLFTKSFSTTYTLLRSEGSSTKSKRLHFTGRGQVPIHLRDLTDQRPHNESKTPLCLVRFYAVLD